MKGVFITLLLLAATTCAVQLESNNELASLINQRLSDSELVLKKKKKKKTVFTPATVNYKSYPPIAVQGQDKNSRVQDNCVNKCKNVFNYTGYAVNSVLGDTYEYSACVQGCSWCEDQLTNYREPYTCFQECKNEEWEKRSTPLLKGIIEMDKACQMGCVMGSCQVVCSGSREDTVNQWSGGSGCRIQTGGTFRPYYTQNPVYSPGSSGAKGNECCSNSMTVCPYTGKKPSQNYNKALAEAKRYCPGATASAICANFENQCN